MVLNRCSAAHIGALWQDPTCDATHPCTMRRPRMYGCVTTQLVHREMTSGVPWHTGPPWEDIRCAATHWCKMRGPWVCRGTPVHPERTFSKVFSKKLSRFYKLTKLLWSTLNSTIYCVIWFSVIKFHFIHNLFQCLIIQCLNILNIRNIRKFQWQEFKKNIVIDCLFLT